MLTFQLSALNGLCFCAGFLMIDFKLYFNGFVLFCKLPQASSWRGRITVFQINDKYIQNYLIPNQSIDQFSSGVP